MRKFPLFTLVALTLLFSSFSFAQSAAAGGPKARVHRGDPALAPASGSPVATVAQFLRQRGANAATAASVNSSAQYRSAKGLVHLRLQQTVGGLRVANTYAKAAIDSKGSLVHLIENFAPVTGAGLKPATATERQALRAALANLHPDASQDPAIAGRQGNTTVFAKSSFFHTAPTVERVAIADDNGSLQSGFLVVTWTEKKNQLHHTLVSGAGQVVSVESRTNTESGNYKIFPKDPVTTPQTIKAGQPGWLFSGQQNSTNIAGNNVNAYLDVLENNLPDRGGRIILDGNFITDANPAQTPSTSTNREVAVQNLFYLNNVIHDALKTYGFTEGAGNFQETNFSGQGLGSDSVNAEAQDGGGTDNANFATPSDGSNPRMQMYLWTGKGSHQVAVNSPTQAIYRAQGAEWGAALTPTGITGDVVLVNDGTGTTTDGCEAVTNNLSGKIALVDRGSCDFVVKAANAQAAGATAVIVANNRGDSIITMGGSDRSVRIGGVFISQTDGATLRSLSSPNATARLTDPAPLQRDGDLDSDIVWHEYGHGLTWRMIGGMSGSMSGSIGEGMADVLAIVINDEDRVAEYSTDDPVGLRRAPYTNYPFTYKSVANAEVHDGGEVYAAIGWQLYTNYKNARGSKLTKHDVLSDMVDGMNFTPSRPTFEQMRDGILTSVKANNPARECLVWQAFAKYGVGQGAKATVTTTPRSTNVTIVESFALPSQCQ